MLTLPFRAHLLATAQSDTYFSKSLPTALGLAGYGWFLNVHSWQKKKINILRQGKMVQQDSWKLMELFNFIPVLCIENLL